MVRTGGVAACLAITAVAAAVAQDTLPTFRAGVETLPVWVRMDQKSPGHVQHECVMALPISVIADFAVSRADLPLDVRAAALAPAVTPFVTVVVTARVRRPASGGDVIALVDLPAGRYAMTASAHGEDSLAGSVHTPIDLASTAPLWLSGVLIGTRSGVASPPDNPAGLVLTREFPQPNRRFLRIYGEPFEPVGFIRPSATIGFEPDRILPMVPTARREFARTDVVTALVRVYQAVIVGLPVTVRRQILDASRRARFDEQHTFEPSVPSGPPFDDRRDLPLSELAPGEYLLTIRATAGSHQVTREEAFAVR